MPRNSFVHTALEGGKSVASFLRIALAAWWHGEVCPYGQDPSVTAALARQRESANQRPQPLAVFPEVYRLAVHEPWLANPAVRIRCMWEEVGHANARYKYFILTNGHLRTLGMLLCEHELAYMRLYDNYAMAAVDGTLWAGEIRHQPVPRLFATGGIDRRRRCTWSVSVVQRQRRVELQITTGTLIPHTHDFRSLEEAMISAEEWLTELHHTDQPDNGRGSDDAGWVM